MWLPTALVAEVLAMSDDTPIPKPMPQSGRSKPPRIALGFGDDEDEYGRTETTSLDSVLIVFDDVAISFPESEYT